MNTTATKEQIEYRGFTITVSSHQSRFGTIFTTENSYGEPYLDGPIGYQDREAAIEAEKRNLDACIDQ